MQHLITAAMASIFSTVLLLVVCAPVRIETANTSTTAPDDLDQQVSQEPWVQPWFILLVIVAILLLLFLFVVLCMRYSAAKAAPKIRHRMPLPYPDGDPPRDVFVVGAENGSVVDANTAMATNPESNRDTLIQGPGVGVLNPVFMLTPPDDGRAPDEGGGGPVREDGDGQGGDGDDDGGSAGGGSKDVSQCPSDDGKDLDVASSLDQSPYTYTTKHTIIPGTHL